MLDDIRKQIVKLIYEKGEAHIGSCLSCVEILQAIKSVMQDGDTFILSKAHAQRAVDVIGMPGQVKELVCYGGSLGNGIGIGLGIALSRPDRKVYVLVGDGELDEGSNWEAIRYIERNYVSNIQVIVDYNGLSSYQEQENVEYAFSGCEYMLECDGHDLERLLAFICCYDDIVLAKTIKGKGIPELENKLESHYHHITKDEYERWTA